MIPEVLEIWAFEQYTQSITFSQYINSQRLVIFPLMKNEPFQLADH